MFQKAYLVDLNSSSALVEPTHQKHAPVHWMYYVPESLFEWTWELLQHRLNQCLFEACTGVMTQAWILCQNPNGYYLDTERPVEPTPSICHPLVLPMVTIFLQWTSNGYVTLSTLYKGIPWLIWTAFDTLNTWGHPWEEEKVLWAKEWRSSTLIVLQPWRIQPLQV